MTQRTTRRRFLGTAALAGAGFAGARVLGASRVESAPPTGTPWYRRTLRWMQTNIEGPGLIDCHLYRQPGASCSTS